MININNFIKVLLAKVVEALVSCGVISLFLDLQIFTYLIVYIVFGMYLRRKEWVEGGNE